jgi:uncharacterized membrane protein YbhN (UPF0104 family)
VFGKEFASSGGGGIRTRDLLNAIQTRSQLRHAPNTFSIYQAGKQSQGRNDRKSTQAGRSACFPAEDKLDLPKRRGGRPFALDKMPLGRHNAFSGQPADRAPPAFEEQEPIVKKQITVTFLKYGLGLGVLAWVLWRYWRPADGSAGLADALQQQVHWMPLLAALIIYAACAVLTFVRWYFLVRAQGLSFTLNGALRLGFMGYFVSTFIPGATLGGDVIKAAFLARQQDRRTVAVATVLIDRLVGLCGLFWLVALVGGVFWAGGWLHEFASTSQAAAALETIVSGAWVLTGGSLAFWVLLGLLPSRRADIFAGRLMKIPKIGGSLAELWRALWLYRCRGGSIALGVLLAMIGHVGFVVSFFFAARTLCPPEAVPSLGVHFFLVPLGILIQAGFPAPGGLGGTEFAFGWLYALAGFVRANGVLASLVQRSITWVVALFGYLVYLRRQPTVPVEVAEMESETEGLQVVAKAG